MLNKQAETRKKSTGDDEAPNRNKSKSAQTRSETNRGARSGFRSVSPNSRSYSHRVSHYQTATNKQTSVSGQNDMLTKQQSQSEEGARRDEESVVSPTEMVTLGGLKKMTKRHEHLTKVRQAQNAAVKIQRAWKRYRSRV